MATGNAFGGGKTVVLTSLDWPPYTGETLFRKGATAEVVRAAFEAVGYDLEIRFFPWNRAVDEAVNNPGVAGYFPEYHSDERASRFLYSASVGDSPLGLVQRVDGGDREWKSVFDLGRYRIGIVRGYVNTREFDSLVAAGEIPVDASVNDMINLRKLLAGRVDMAVADTNVFRFLSHHDPFLHRGRDKLEINPRLLTTHGLHVCFRRDSAGEKLLKLFNEGLSRVDALRIQQEYIDAIHFQED